MGIRYEWDTANTSVSLATQEELSQMPGVVPEEVESGGLIIGGGTGGGFIIEGDNDQLFEFVQRVMTLLHQQQADDLEREAGRPIDSLVKIGSGTKVWRITGYTRMGNDIVAHLAPMPGQGFSTTSVVVHRLKDADQ